MTREEKIAAIYKEMANTDTTIGCRVQIEWFGKMLKGTILDGTNILREDGEVEENGILRNVEIIGHPVMIGDVLDWIGEKEFNANAKIPGFGFEDSENLDNESKLWLIQNHYSGRVCVSWLNKRTPIDDQSDECIDYVYSLIQKD